MNVCVCVCLCVNICDYPNVCLPNSIPLASHSKDLPLFQIYSDDGEEVGSIECHNSAKNRLVFPADQQIRNKVLLLGTALDIVSVYWWRFYALSQEIDD